MKPGLAAFLAGWNRRDAEHPLPLERWPAEVRRWRELARHADELDLLPPPPPAAQGGLW
jgi:hypothetical protein